jgi:hypothetical protein
MPVLEKEIGQLLVNPVVKELPEGSTVKPSKAKKKIED